MKRWENEQNNSEMMIYTTEDGLTKIETTFDGDTVWLSIDQMAELFQRDKSTISRHIKNIFTEGELKRETFSKRESFKRQQYGQNLPTLLPTEKCMMSIIIILMLSFLSATV